MKWNLISHNHHYTPISSRVSFPPSLSKPLPTICILPIHLSPIPLPSSFPSILFHPSLLSPVQLPSLPPNAIGSVKGS